MGTAAIPSLPATLLDSPFRHHLLFQLFGVHLGPGAQPHADWQSPQVVAGCSSPHVSNRNTHTAGDKYSIKYLGRDCVTLPFLLRAEVFSSSATSVISWARAQQYSHTGTPLRYSASSSARLFSLISYTVRCHVKDCRTTDVKHIRKAYCFIGVRVDIQIYTYN